MLRKFESSVPPRSLATRYCHPTGRRKRFSWSSVEKCCICVGPTVLGQVGLPESPFLHLASSYVQRRMEATHVGIYAEIASSKVDAGVSNSRCSFYRLSVRDISPMGQ